MFTFQKLWEPKVFLQLFEDSIICSDSWNNCLVTCTSNGVFVIDGIYMKTSIISEGIFLKLLINRGDSLGFEANL